MFLRAFSWDFKYHKDKLPKKGEQTQQCRTRRVRDTLIVLHFLFNFHQFGRWICPISFVMRLCLLGSSFNDLVMMFLIPRIWFLFFSWIGSRGSGTDWISSYELLAGLLWGIYTNFSRHIDGIHDGYGERNTRNNDISGLRELNDLRADSSSFSVERACVLTERRQPRILDDGNRRYNTASLCEYGFNFVESTCLNHSPFRQPLNHTTKPHSLNLTSFELFFSTEDLKRIFLFLQVGITTPLDFSID